MFCLMLQLTQVDRLESRLSLMAFIDIFNDLIDTVEPVSLLLDFLYIFIMCLMISVYATLN